MRLTCIVPMVLVPFDGDGSVDTAAFGSELEFPPTQGITSIETIPVREPWDSPGQRDFWCPTPMDVFEDYDRKTRPGEGSHGHARARAVG